MCPLVSGPLTGYTDFQRTVALDAPMLFSGQFTLQPGTPQFLGVYDVSRFTYTQLAYAMNVPTLITATWYQSVTNTVVVGRRSWTTGLQALASPLLNVKLPNYGGGLIIEMQALVAPSAQSSMILLPSNRVPPMETYPTMSVLDFQTNVTITGSHQWYSAPCNYTGPVQVYAFCTQATRVLLQALQSNNQYVTIAGADLAASVDGTWTWVAPMDEFQVEIINQSASNGQLWYAISTSDTGSS